MEEEEFLPMFRKILRVEILTTRQIDVVYNVNEKGLFEIPSSPSEAVKGGLDAWNNNLKEELVLVDKYPAEAKLLEEQGAILVNPKNLLTAFRQAVARETPTYSVEGYNDILLGDTSFGISFGPYTLTGTSSRYAWRPSMNPEELYMCVVRPGRPNSFLNVDTGVFDLAENQIALGEISEQTDYAAFTESLYKRFAEIAKVLVNAKGCAELTKSKRGRATVCKSCGYQFSCLASASK